MDSAPSHTENDTGTHNQPPRHAFPWLQDIEHTLETEGMLASTTVGVSMWPMLRNRLDTIIVRPADSLHTDHRLHRYDVPLYRRASDGAYVLHRVVNIHTTGSALTYLIRGDNTYALEYVKPEQIVGVLTEYYRGNRRIDLDGFWYRSYARIWTAIYPLRSGLQTIRRLLAKTPLKPLYHTLTRHNQ